MDTTEQAQPGKTYDCRERPKDAFLDPRCASLIMFLEGTDTYWVYQYYYCPRCERIWESSKFYQDWEPFWEILEWEKFTGMKERWCDGGGRDYYPATEIGMGREAFGRWVLGLDAPYSLEY